MNKNEEYKPVFYENFQPVALNITRREWFAGMALQGLATHQDWYLGTAEKPYNPWPQVAKQAYDMADAMIKARPEW